MLGVKEMLCKITIVITAHMQGREIAGFTSL